MATKMIQGERRKVIERSNWDRRKYFSGIGVMVIPLFFMATLFLLPCKVTAQEG
ncbi:MAG: hypothetical protein GQ556_11140 [Desulfobacterales bacterium]|nr:hypothetical protein [Desulfobacterales bacterium]